MTVTLWRGDCLERMGDIPSGSVDAVVTDPPYGIGYASSRTMRLNGEPRRTRPQFGADVFCAEWLVDVYRVLKADTCLYVFTRWDITHQWKAAIEAVGFKVTQRLVWDKKHWKMGDLRYYGSQTEDVLFCRKGTPTMHYPKRCGNLLSYSSGYLPEGQYDHPTQKPEHLMERFILDSTLPDQVVLDPFMGSGSTGVAAFNVDRRFIGIERDDYSFAIAEARIKAAQSQARQLPLAV